MNNYFIRNFAKNVYWSVYGGTIKNPSLPSNIKSVLFICLGNICRSPFAERIFSKYSSNSNNIISYSAGIHVEYPKSPPLEAIISAKEFSVSLDDHSSRKIEYSMIESYDMVIAMEVWQYKYLRKMYLEFEDKIFLLPLFDIKYKKSESKYDHFNIKDPFGKGISYYNECFKRIEINIESLFDLINK
jgi:protein-tyrosine phosphatase